MTAFGMDPILTNPSPSEPTGKGVAVDHSAPPAPILSVIVPVYNSSRDLRRCLEALAGSTFRRFEVLVVDDGSTESIEPIVAAWGFRYLRIDGPGGPARARNLGAREVRCPWLVFIDADVVVHKDTMGRFSEALESDRGVDAVIGTYDDTPDDPGFLSQYKNIFHHFVHLESHGDVSTFWSGCGAIRRDLFLGAGGFDEVRYRRPAIEDIELGTWLTAAGHRIVLDHRIRCKHLKRWTWRNLLKTDIFDRGIPWTRLMLRAKEIPNTLNVTTGQRVCVALMGAMVTMSVLGFIRPWFWLAAGGGLTVITLLNLRFYNYFRTRKGIWFAARVVPLHWLYLLYCGLSFAVGWSRHWMDGRPVGPTRSVPSPGDPSHGS